MRQFPGDGTRYLPWYRWLNKKKKKKNDEKGYFFRAVQCAARRHLGQENTNFVEKCRFFRS